MRSGRDSNKRRSPPITVASMLVFTTCCVVLLHINIAPVETYTFHNNAPDSKLYFAYERGFPWTWKTQLTTDRALPTLDVSGYNSWLGMVGDFCVGIVTATVLSLVVSRILSTLPPDPAEDGDVDDVAGQDMG